MLNIVTGVEKTPIKICIYGAEGVGKTSLAAHMPEPLFIDTEGGTSRLNVRRIKCTKWEDLISIVKEVIDTPTVCKTLVVDTADWAESLCINFVCNKYRKANIEDFGYGKGYTYLAEEFSEFLKLLNQLVDVGINPVVIAHGKPRKYELPEEQGQFDRWEMKLSKQVAPLIKEWCDMLLFCNYKTFVVTTENNTKKAQGGKRVMYTTHNPCWDAKNRFNLPDELDLSINSISHLFSEHGAKQSDTKPNEKQERTNIVKLKNMLVETGIDEDSFKKVVAERGHYSVSQPLEEYSDDFITRWVIPNWKKIVEAIKNNESKGDK
ncbi:hypothetical protein MBVR141_1013 [Mycoplasmopsis bovirhinis]|uniref:ATP-binding protein n=1 Tax=Mycoplasmopsis bovirhinis TaxID=29553 RepID=UPI000BB9C7B9|nr:ATP-binding protein [Mycoplasmopsis bovirhinis]BBA22616.1 hypothetical protein MBVR141_1013 [Mycoplasmopsis bovirhinis]